MNNNNKLGVRKYWKEYLEYISVFFGLMFFITYFTEQFIIISVFISNGELDFTSTIHFFYVAHTILLFIILLVCFIYYFSTFKRLRKVVE